MNHHLEVAVLRMSEDRAKRIVYELVRMDLDEAPLRGDELADIILYDNDDYDGRKMYACDKITEHGDPRKEYTYRDPELLGADYEDWLNAVQNSPDI